MARAGSERKEDERVEKNKGTGMGGERSSERKKFVSIKMH